MAPISAKAVKITISEIRSNATAAIPALKDISHCFLKYTGLTNSESLKGKTKPKPYERIMALNAFLYDTNVLSFLLKKEERRIPESSSENTTNGWTRKTAIMMSKLI